MHTEETITTDISKFGARERAVAGDLLVKSSDGFPVDFNDDGVTVMFNMNSGNVFLTNSDFQVCMLNDGKLESFYSCPECGTEGFFDEVKDADVHLGRDGSRYPECREWIREIRRNRK